MQTNCQLFNYMVDLQEGLRIHGYHLNKPYVVIRYIGYIQEDGDPTITNTDWYSVAWVCLLQVLPSAKQLEIIADITFPDQPDHIKYHILVAEIEEYCAQFRRDNDPSLSVTVFDGDIILVAGLND